MERSRNSKPRTGCGESPPSASRSVPTRPQRRPSPPLSSGKLFSARPGHTSERQLAEAACSTAQARRQSWARRRIRVERGSPHRPTWSPRLQAREFSAGNCTKGTGERLQLGAGASAACSPAGINQSRAEKRIHMNRAYRCRRSKSRGPVSDLTVVRSMLQPVQVCFESIIISQSQNCSHQFPFFYPRLRCLVLLCGDFQLL